MFLKIVWCVGLTVITFGGVGQNLVPNPQFENTTSCDFRSGVLDSCEHWFSVKPSPDYYHRCISSSYPGEPDVPVVWAGRQNARSGQGMAGFFASERRYGPDFREYAHVELTQPLDSGCLYFVQFHVNLSERSHYGVTTFGAYLSDTLPMWFGNRFDVTPHVLHQSTPLLDTISWMEVSGWYQSVNGREKYLTIGNFFTDSLSQIYNIHSTAEGRAYYFLDDVCVSKDSTVCSQMQVNSIWETHPEFDFEVYPNPVQDLLHIEIDNPKDYDIMIFSVDGRERNIPIQLNDQNRISCNTAALESGVYLITVRDASKVTRKLVVKQ